MPRTPRAAALTALCVTLAACGLRPDSDVEPASLPPLPAESVPSQALSAAPRASAPAASPAPTRTPAASTTARTLPSASATPSPATSAPAPLDPPSACPGGDPSRSARLQRSAQAAAAIADPGVVWVLASGVRDTGPSPERPGLRRYALSSPETLTAAGPPAPRFVDGSPRFALDGLTLLSPSAHLVVDRDDPTLLRRAVEVRSDATARFLLDCDAELTGVLQAYARDRLRADGAVIASIARKPGGATARDLVEHALSSSAGFQACVRSGVRCLEVG